MKAVKAERDEMRAEYKREDFGKIVRGKHAAEYAKATNLVLLDDKIAKAENDALRGLLTLAKTASSGTRTTKAHKRAA
jgi:hypothetical protein